jgi:sulfinoalanine decarboxylase/sulfinoalanine decarboxylase/aspartate 1-decarboxylase
LKKPIFAKTDIISMKEDLALFQKITEKLLKAEQEKPVLEPLAADEIFEKLDLRLEEGGIHENDLAQALEKLVLNTPRTATRQFFNQLFGGRNSKAVLGDLLAVVLNNSMYTYKVAGPMVGVEKEIIRNTSKMLGYPAQADGTIAPGGSMTNLMAMIMGRDAHNEKIKSDGVSSKMTLYTSKESHYSIPKNAAFMGIGRKQLRYVEADRYGRMDSENLEAQIKQDLAQGLEPFFINATAGTTVMGAFDPIEPLAELAEKYKLWLHVDGAYCGPVLFSDKYKHLIKGAERADSFSYNAHKMLATPLTCSVIVAQNKKYLHDSFSNDADYLYQTDGDDYNLGKISLQCGRRNDALKFWTLWKAVGRKGLGQMVDHQFHLAEVARSYVEKHPDYTLYSYPESVGICFNYKDLPAHEICSQLYEAGELMVGFGQFREDQFIRLVSVNAGNTEEDIHTFFNKLEAFAEKHLLETSA